MMRHHLLLLFSVVLLFVLVTGAGTAQETDEPDPVIVNGYALDRSILPGAMIAGIATPVPLQDSVNGLLAMVAEDPSDTCEDATDIALLPNFPADGVSFDVNNVTEDADDPVLACMWGNPSRSQGYRTVWYRLVVPASGRITLDTFGSAYDTVIGVFKGECGTLEPVSCNDDSNGFASETTIAVTAGEIYYIVVADWQPSVPAARTLNFSALLQPIDLVWRWVDTKPLSPAISRHATVSKWDLIYVVGGQTNDPNGGDPDDSEAGPLVVSNRLQRLNITTNEWQELASIPGGGYSNTTVALVGDRIYLPSGYDGNDLGYDGLHWVYVIDPDRSKPGHWTRAANVPQVRGENFAWAASAVPPTNDKYYLMGGTSSTVLFDTGTISNDEAFIYYADSDFWQKIPEMQTARYAHTGTWLEANDLGACVAGGLGVQDSGQFVFHSSAECYSPSKGWRFIGDMNIPRIGAGSVTGPDGKWYVFGGLTAVNTTTLIPVLPTEVYDPYRNTWSLLSPEYNLGGRDLGSARAFTSGSMVGNELVVTGGSVGFLNGSEQALPLTEKTFLPSNSVYMPTLLDRFDDFQRPDDSFEDARPLSFGQTQERNFSGQRDFIDTYTFSLSSTTPLKIKLEVPDKNDFDLFLYGQNKLLWSLSESPLQGEDEVIKIVLDPRRYYVMVKRSFPTDQPDKSAYYRLTLTHN